MAFSLVCRRTAAAACDPRVQRRMRAAFARRVTGLSAHVGKLRRFYEGWWHELPNGVLHGFEVSIQHRTSLLGTRHSELSVTREWRDNLRHGLQRKSFLDGRPYSISHWLAGQRHGLSVKYGKDGSPADVRRYIHGRCVERAAASTAPAHRPPWVRVISTSPDGTPWEIEVMLPMFPVVQCGQLLYQCGAVNISRVATAGRLTDQMRTRVAAELGLPSALAAFDAEALFARLGVWHPGELICSTTATTVFSESGSIRRLTCQALTSRRVLKLKEEWCNCGAPRSARLYINNVLFRRTEDLRRACHPPTRARLGPRAHECLYECYPSGGLRRCCPLRNGMLDGLARSYAECGRLRHATAFVRGMPSGTRLEFVWGANAAPDALWYAGWMNGVRHGATYQLDCVSGRVGSHTFWHAGRPVPDRLASLLGRYSLDVAVPRPPDGRPRTLPPDPLPTAPKWQRSTLLNAWTDFAVHRGV